MAAELHLRKRFEQNKRYDAQVYSVQFCEIRQVLLKTVSRLTYCNLSSVTSVSKPIDTKNPIMFTKKFSNPGRYSLA
jgi:hypothetical protein